jgi:hypothetical protein
VIKKVKFHIPTKIEMRPFALFFVSFVTWGQTYSTIIPDKEITDFINWEIAQTPKGKYALKKIFNRPHLWEDANFIAPPDSLQYDLGYELNFLYKKENHLETLFSDQDTAYFLEQFKAMKPTLWNGIDNLRVSTRRKNAFGYSVPIFSKNKAFVIVYKSEYRGPESGKGAYYIYKKTANGWLFVKAINHWMS